MAETVKPEITTAMIDAAVAAARMCGAGRFTVKEVLTKLPGRKTKALTERVERSLEADESFFGDEAGNFCGRAEFFTGGHFLVTPDELEIEEGILIPGHRFAAYLEPEVFPSEVTLRPAGSDTPLQQREFSGALATIFHYHLLLGSEQVFDFLIAEHGDNARLADGVQSGDKVKLNVFDCKALYKVLDFQEGDALLCRVVDYAAGIVEFEYLSGAKRSGNEVKLGCAAIEETLQRVIDRFDNYLDIPAQLAWSCYFGGEALLEKPRASFDEWLRQATSIEINFDSGHTVLARRRHEEDVNDADMCGGDHDHDHEDALEDGTADIPDGVGVSKGEVGNLSSMLGEIGLALTPVEIDSYILDCCYTRELDYESFYARCFGRELDFADTAQEAVFLNYVEDRWEQLTQQYDRVSDEPKGEVRGAILEVLDAKNSFLDVFRGDPEAAKRLPTDKMRQLAEISHYLDELLRLLNSSAHTFVEGEAEAMSERIADIADSQRDLIESMEA